MISQRNVIRKLTSRAQDQDRDALQSSPLLGIHTEMPLLVARHLPQHLRALRSEAPGVRFEFLALLERDLLRDFACRKCLCLHPISTVTWPGVERSPQALKCAEGGMSCYLPVFGVRYQIYSAHVHLALRQHARGTDLGWPMEAFHDMNIEEDQYDDRIVLTSVDAAIVSAELLVRSQSWILFPRERLPHFVHKLPDRVGLGFLCRHHALGLAHLLESLLPNPTTIDTPSPPPDAPWQGRTETWQCSECLKDFIIEVQDLGPRDCAVLLTTWVNLGDGSVFGLEDVVDRDPSQPRPRRNAILRAASRMGVRDRSWTYRNSRFGNMDPSSAEYHASRPGSVRAHFEQQTDVPVAELTARNEVTLFLERKKRPQYRGLDGVKWI